jgi:p24 family protein beta-1
VHTLKGKSGDKFEFKAPKGGMYKFCFHNPYGAPETVSFYIHVGHIPNEHNLAKDGSLLPLYLKLLSTCLLCQSYPFCNILNNHQFN